MYKTEPKYIPSLWLVKSRIEQAVFGASALALQMRQEGFREESVWVFIGLMIHQGTHAFERE